MPLLNSGAALFAGGVEEFVRMAPASTLTAHLRQAFNDRWGRVSQSEVESWRHSLTALAQVVETAGVQRAGVGVEVKLPLTDRRIDASFVARDGTGRPHVVLVELKQWESASPSLNPDNVLMGGREHLHPSVQAAAYAAYLRESHSAFTEHQYQLSPCAFLHNMPAEIGHALKGVEFAGPLREAPLFVREDADDLADLLNGSLQGGDGMALLPGLTQGRYSPSKELIVSIKRSLEGSPVWKLLDEQLVAYNIVRGLVERAAQTGEKAVVMVVGGPGTGKSVIAVHLLVALSAQGRYRVCHATGSKAFTTNLRAICPPGGAAVFRYFNSFRHKDTKPNEVDALVCDEAHRIRETSNDRFTRRALRSEISQVRELIRAARVSVFLLDERQNVRSDEIGSTAAIEEGARLEGIAPGGKAFHRIDLRAQFRCNGCAPYIELVDQLLSEAPEKPGGWLAADEYDLRLYLSPQAMETALHAEIDKGGTGRLVAGFCWPWSDPARDGSLAKDVKIGDWERPWNEKSPEQCRPPRPAPRPGQHPYYLWATQEKGIGEVGCIYSAQGFEFDYCGVILGNDFVWRSEVGWVATRDASKDPAILRRKLDPATLKALLGHTYRVLLTRGLKGTFIYSTDFETREFLRTLLTAPA